MAEIIKLNVGGIIYTTTRSTLTRYPNSMLGSMFSGRMPTTKDEHDNYWIDGNGEIFRYVLDFLRRSRLLLPERFDEFDLLEMEADFYQIPEMTKAVKESRSLRQGGQGNAQSKGQYLVVNYEDGTPRESNPIGEVGIDIYGPKEVVVDVHTSLQCFHRDGTNEIRSDRPEQGWITIYPYDASILPQYALTQVILNLGFKLCPMPLYHEWTDCNNRPCAIAKLQWFVRDEIKDDLAMRIP